MQRRTNAAICNHGTAHRQTRERAAMADDNDDAASPAGEDETSQAPATGRAGAGRRLKVAGHSIPVPRSRAARRLLGGALIVGGILGFLPVLGFWMVPLGILILSQDSHRFRRLRRWAEVKLGRRRK